MAKIQVRQEISLSSLQDWVNTYTGLAQTHLIAQGVRSAVELFLTTRGFNETEAHKAILWENSSSSMDTVFLVLTGEGDRFYAMCRSLEEFPRGPGRHLPVPAIPRR